MCLLAFHVGFSPKLPLLLAANREEAYARPSYPPEHIHDSPPVMCGIDALAGGTWLGVNAAGIVVAVTNRPHVAAGDHPRSRGLLCRDLLRHPSAKSAAEQAMQELASANYNGVNFLIIDSDHAIVVHGGAQLELLELSSGLHLLTNGDVNDVEDARQARAKLMFRQLGYESAAEFVVAAKQVCADTGDIPDIQQDVSAAANIPIVIRGEHRGTVSSSIITLGASSEDCRYLFAPGSPDSTDYMDLSDPLRWLLGKVSRDQDEGQSHASH